MVILVLAVLAVLLAGCSSPTATPAATPTATPAASATPTSTTPAPAQASVQIKDFAFSPQDARVAKGGTVTWTNLDNTAHTISFSGVQSKVLNNGDTYSKTFNETGTFDYNCGIHTYMKGRVVVE
ncbi:MAG: plastocyanin/azurin family copper-binding protein [Methanocella sp.]